MGHHKYWWKYRTFSGRCKRAGLLGIWFSEFYIVFVPKTPKSHPLRVVSLWKFQFRFILSFKNDGFSRPPKPLRISNKPPCGGHEDFLERHIDMQMSHNRWLHQRSVEFLLHCTLMLLFFAIPIRPEGRFFWGRVWSNEEIDLTSTKGAWASGDPGGACSPGNFEN